MPYTLWSSIEKYRRDVVDLDPDETRIARSSRDFLFTQLKSLDVDNRYIFPKLYNNPISYGSFARKTKIRPLDDIDLLLPLKRNGTVPREAPGRRFVYDLWIEDEDSVLEPYRDSYGSVSSIKVLNAIKSGLSKLAHYKKADISRNQQAIVLDLSSYDWSFDIVPAVPIKDKYSDNGEIAYYLIPDGSGDWIRTDPRKDGARLTSVNQQHTVNIQGMIRLLKRWNRRTTKPCLESYYFEALCLNVFDYAPRLTWISEAVEYFFQLGQYYLRQSCPDPKGLGDALDANVDSEIKSKVEKVMMEAYWLASEANRFDKEGKDKDAIERYRMLFGEEFPSYG